MIKVSEYSIIGAGRFAGKKQVSFHSHAGMELIYVRSGSCTIVADGNSFEGIPGTLFIIPLGLSHNQLNHEFTETIFCYFTGGNMTQAEVGVFKTGQDFWIEHFITDIGLLYSESLYELCSGVIVSLMKRIDSLVTEERGTLPENIKNTLEIMRLEYQQPLTLEIIAGRVGLSVSRLKTSFRQNVGVSPMSYLQQERLFNAEKLLLGTYMRISEIAYACGYSDTCYFTYVFRKKHAGIPPAEFRKKGVKPGRH